MAATDVGDTGFRFVRIDFPPGVCVELTAAAAVYRHCGLTATGTFGCDDARVNEIFSTAARTLYLNMQNGVIWDGIKRDRLVWAGDLHPEILTSLHLFGGTENAKNSLAMCAADAPDGWINGIPAYSMWWMLSVCEYYRYTGDEAFVSGLLPYLIGTLDRLKGAATDSGLQFGGDEMAYFLDWNSFGTKEASAGVHALAIASARRAADLLAAFGKEADISALTGAGIVRAALSGDGTAARAFAYLAGMNAPSVQSAAGMSCFTSLYVLSAMAGQGRGKAALSGMKTFFGGMLDAGATTFWEAFDPVWTAGAGRIDEMSAGDDVHGDRGRHCYTGFRNSLCHGWASSPVPFLHRRVLGIRPVTAGRVELRPDLCGLRRAEGTVPTPFGPLSVCVTAKGTEYEAPAGLTVTVPDENKGN